MYKILHQLHAVVLPEKMNKDAQKFDGSQVMLERALAILQNDQETIVEKVVR